MFLAKVAKQIANVSTTFAKKDSRFVYWVTAKTLLNNYLAKI